ncbi:MAG: flagellar basal body P-ring formation protein FlgA, partial [Betaproteobacteria bacterium]|nr:flagellar basal body P-ring formation protein FlgA [Betaproteobacteria bacterium]
MIRCLTTILCLQAFVFPALASQQKTSIDHQEISVIKNAIENFLYSNTASLPGQVVVNVGQIDKHLVLPKCPQLEPFVPAGGRLWGKTSIGVRCDNETASWTIYVQTEVGVMADILHLARPVSSGQTLTYEDIAPQNVNLTQMPEGILTNAAQIVGKVATTNLPAGQPLRSQMLRAPYAIIRGQTVNLVVQGRGFSIRSEGQALINATEGQIIQVRNKSGRILNGLARANSIVE